MSLVVASQVLLVSYHQITTWCDFHPFNGVRGYSRQEKLAEAGSNAVLMSLAPIGFIFHIKGLMTFGVVYYFVLFAIELLIWWVPYFTVPSGRWRSVYNRLLSVATSHFSKGDTLDHWTAIYQRLHRGTITFLPMRDDRPVPNLEHTILHAWTLFTAIVTLLAYLAGSR
jgi:hypothetical protein